MSATYIVDLKKRLARFCADFGVISCATEETPQGAANVQPGGRVGPNAAPMATLLFIYTIAVWRELAR